LTAIAIEAGDKFIGMLTLIQPNKVRVRVSFRDTVQLSKFSTALHTRCTSTSMAELVLAYAGLIPTRSQFFQIPTDCISSDKVRVIISTGNLWRCLDYRNKPQLHQELSHAPDVMV